LSDSSTIPKSFWEKCMRRIGLGTFLVIFCTSCGFMDVEVQDLTEKPGISFSLSDSTSPTEGYAAQTNVDVQLVGNVSAVDKWCLSELQTTPPANTSTCVGSTWQSSKPTSYTLSAGDGSKKVFLWTADQHDSVSGRVVQASIVLDTTSPTVTLSSPLAGAYILGQGTQNISWTSTDSNSRSAGVSLYYSENGITWQPITQDLAASGSYSWSVPALADNLTFSLKAVAIDLAGNPGEDSKTNAYFLDSAQPNITGVTLSSTAVKDGDSLQIDWNLTEFFAAATQDFTLEYSINNGSSWNPMTTISAADGPLTNQAFTHTWTVPSASSAQSLIRISYSDLAGRSVIAQSSVFTIDSDLPTVTSLNINNGATNATNNYVDIDINASDTTGNVSHFCLRYNDNNPPGLSDSCWFDVTSPLINLTPAQTLSLDDFSYSIGFTTATYDVYIWVRDEAGNISTLTAAGAGTDTVDRKSIDFDPGSPPEVTSVLATSTDSPSEPPVSGDLNVGAGNDVYIKWKITDVEGLSATPVSIYYTENDTDYTLITENLANAQGGGCTIAGDLTGCYVWSGGAPATYFKVRVVAIDAASLTTFSSSPPLNVFPPINILAGNTDPGLGSHASAAMFYSNTSSANNADPFSLVVTKKGVIYFKDKDRGLLMIDPANGTQQLLLRQTSLTSGDGGDVGLATARYINKIALDFEENLWVLDYEFIRKIDTSAMTIDTVIGGGASQADTDMAPTDIQITGQWYEPSNDHSPLIPLPNGDLIFTVNHYTGSPNSGYRIRIYDKSENLIKTIRPNGLGHSASAAIDISECQLRYLIPILNATSKEVDYFVLRAEALGACTVGGILRIDPTTGTSYGQEVFTGGDASYQVISRQTGETYSFSRLYGQIHKWNEATLTWDTLYGAGVGSCPDGDAAATCRFDFQDVFIANDGKFYIADRGRIRVITAAGNMLTIAGQGTAYGDGGNALFARFGTINSFDQRSSGEITILDNVNYRFREFSVGGNVATIAGNGSEDVSDEVTPATNQGIRLTGSGPIWDDFVVNPTSGNVYFMGIGFDRIMQLNRGTGLWEWVVGGGATHYTTADGLASSAIDWDGYPGRVIGFNTTTQSIIAIKHRWTGNHTDMMLKNFDIATWTQSHLAGITGAGTGMCIDGTAVASCSLPEAYSSMYRRMHWDEEESKWLFAQNSQRDIRALPPGGLVSTLVSTEENVGAFAYRRDNNGTPGVTGDDTEYIYYCDTDKRIRKRVVGNPSDDILGWPIPGLDCVGRTMLWNESRGSIIFIYRQNGLYGIAEYINP
jgi:hypothetical protein